MRFFALIFFFCLTSLSSSQAGLFGGGGSDQYAPDKAQSGSPIIIKFIVDTWGGGDPITNRYTDITLHYKLVSEDKNNWDLLQPVQTELPENYKKASSEKRQWEAYQFTIPPYSPDISGQIEYYITMKFDGYDNTIPGMKKITLTHGSAKKEGLRKEPFSSIDKNPS